jgi:hypothetical protein
VVAACEKYPGKFDVAAKMIKEVRLQPPRAWRVKWHHISCIIHGITYFHLAIYNLSFIQKSCLQIIAATCSLELFALQTMDKKFAPNWHCIMGGSLGFEVILNFKSFCAFCNDFLSI